MFDRVLNMSLIISAERTDHCVKYRNFNSFPGVEILWESKIYAAFQVIRYSRN